MKILISAVSYYPNISGAAVSAHLLAQFLSNKGHEVAVVAPSQGLFDQIEKENERLTVYRLAAIPNPMRQGYFVPVFTKRKARRIVREFRPDVVHLHDPLALSGYIRDEAHKLGAPVVVTNHFTLDYVLAYVPRFLHFFARPIVTNKLVQFYNKCEAVTCPTDTIVEILVKMGVTRPIHALSNGVDLHRFFAHVSTQGVVSKYRLPNRQIVLYLGRIDKDKSIEVLVKAIPKVLEKIKAFFVFAGSGDDIEMLKDELKKLNLNNDTAVTGPISHDSEDLVAIYQLADIFVIPSEIETQSIVTMEAMAAGKPIVAANAGALPELVENEKNGYLFKPGNSTSLAIDIVRLLENKHLHDKMREASLEKIAKHELKHSLGLFEKLYEEWVTKFKTGHEGK